MRLKRQSEIKDDILNLPTTYLNYIAIQIAEQYANYRNPNVLYELSKFRGFQDNNVKIIITVGGINETSTEELLIPIHIFNAYTSMHYGFHKILIDYFLKLNMEDAIIAEGGWKSFNESKDQYIVYTKEQGVEMFSANIGAAT